MPNLDFYGWSEISTQAFNMYVPYIKISQWDDVNSTPNNSLFADAIWNILSNRPTPTYFVSNLLLNINNGLNVQNAANVLSLTSPNGRTLTEICEADYNLESLESPSPYNILTTPLDHGTYELQVGLWYGGLDGTNAGYYPYYYTLVMTPSKTALFIVRDYDVDVSKGIGETFKSRLNQTWCNCVLVWDRTTFEQDFPNATIENPPRIDRDKDPYSQGDYGGASTTGGGHGTSGNNNYDSDSDPNPVPSLPTISVADTGFITLYNPSATQLKNLANYLWGNLFDVTTWKKVMADPMDAILGLSIVPVAIPHGGSVPVTVGNISTGVSLTKASAQFVELNCGTINISELWKAYLDYSPYTRASIYLPFIGSQEIDIDLIQNMIVGVVYHVDILSGACVAFITSGGNVIAQFSGQCAVSIPVTSQDFTQTIMSLCQLVASGVGVVATGGLSAPVQAAAIAGMATAAANTANNVVSSKPTYAKSGNMSGCNGFMGTLTPYFILEMPRQCAPAKQNTFTGYPSYITKTLGLASGFTQVQDIHLENISCTETERREILRLLQTGVIL